MINFVVLTGFSTAADKALLYTTILAKQVPAKIQIHLVHIWHHSILDADYFLEVPIISSCFEGFPVSSRQEHEEALQKRIEKFGREVAISPHFMTGTFADKLPAFLEPLSNPFVILGKSYTENVSSPFLELVLGREE